MSNVLFENLKMYFPSIAKHAVKCCERSPLELIVKCDDGLTFLYDDIIKGARKLPQDSNSMTDDEWRYEFGYQLRKLMERKGMSQLELAERVGISQAMLSNYITGRSMPSFRVVDQMARALGCSTDDLRYI